MKTKSFISATALLATSMFALAACDQQPAEEVLPEMSAERFEAHVRFLASDDLGGRDVGSVGYQTAADYVAQNFSDMGLVPGGEDGGYFQTVTFRSTGVDNEKSTMGLTLGGEDTAATFGDNVVSQGASAAEVMASGDLVFVGYGVQSPEHGVDSFAGVETEGKILVRLYGTPAGLPSDVAASLRNDKPRGGAAGVIVLFSDQLKGRVGSWERLKGFTGGSRLNWFTPDGKGKPTTQEAIAGAMVSPELSATILASIGLDMESAKTAVAADISGSADLKVVSKLGDEISSPNVVGILEGSDPELKDQYVVISAHLDHTGDQCANRNGAGAEGDTICNGAMDNATGTASMLEAARAFTSMGEAPRRSVMFLSVTAEEKGLLGAEYFAYNPTVPRESLVANVNLDMPVLLYDFADVVAFGSEHSSIGPVAARATAKAGINLAEDPMPEEGLFTRSDHYRFVQQGIPSIFLMTGPTAVGDDTSLPAKERNGYKSFRGFLDSNYHSPADDLMQPIVWSAGAKFSLVNYLIIKEIANADEQPRWNEGNSFGDQYAPGEPRAKAE